MSQAAITFAHASHIDSSAVDGGKSADSVVAMEGSECADGDNEDSDEDENDEDVEADDSDENAHESDGEDIGNTQDDEAEERQVSKHLWKQYTANEKLIHKEFNGNAFDSSYLDSIIRYCALLLLYARKHT